MLSEYAEAAQEHASAMTSYIQRLENDGSIDDGTKSRVNVAVNQVNSARNDIAAQQADCT